ncbi:MAG TPA: L-seryl-tRNA(Sec) selenium transferase [Anaerolineales bacterium]|nr:L-seryl-tRNA(Sec) selenium transferase [Anaerolineales bacterium]
MTNLRDLPSVDQLLQQATHLIEAYGRPLTLDALRSTLDEIRVRFRAKPEVGLPSMDAIFARAESQLIAWTAPTLLPVINATGVILHTNLGRAPLSDAAIAAMKEVAEDYSTLEYDLERGQRGSRLLHAESILRKLTGAEAALVVNNNASAILLVLSALANRKRVVISRSQLVEIGGGFRVPDVMKQSGAKLVEVGTTNKVRLSDYSDALTEPVALVMRAHRSNFKIVGFTEEPELKEIIDIAHQANVPVVDDLGSGALLDTAKYGLAHEPTVQESLAAGVDLVCFSGDKLLGGPQAGIIIGKKDLIDKIRKHPLARAVRADKTCLAGITATLLHYLKDEFEREIPVWRMMSLTLEQLKARAEAWREVLGQGSVMQSESTVGGGSLPDECIATYVLALNVRSPATFLKKLREGYPPVIARVENDTILFDPRTVLDDEGLLAKLKSLLAENS